MVPPGSRATSPTAFWEPWRHSFVLRTTLWRSPVSCFSLRHLCRLFPIAMFHVFFDAWRSLPTCLLHAHTWPSQSSSLCLCESASSGILPADHFTCDRHLSVNGPTKACTPSWEYSYVIVRQHEGPEMVRQLLWRGARLFSEVGHHGELHGAIVKVQNHRTYTRCRLQIYKKDLILNCALLGYKTQLV